MALEWGDVDLVAGLPTVRRSRAAESAITGDTRIDWATLLKRVHDADALVVVAILSSLHLPTAPRPIARARSPDYDCGRTDPRLLPAGAPEPRRLCRRQGRLLL